MRVYCELLHQIPLSGSDGLFAVRHEVADGIVLHSNDAVTAPVVPSTVPYAILRRGNDPWEACGQRIPQSSDWRRDREAPVYLAAPAGAGRGSMLGSTDVNVR